MGDLNVYPELDVAIDGADEVDKHLNCIKGGGGCLTQEKIVAFNAKLFVVVADYRKNSTTLGKTWKEVPIEVIRNAYVPLMRKIELELNGKPHLRMAVKKAGPVVTDNFHFILDVEFGLIENPEELNKKLRSYPGVIEVITFFFDFENL